MVTDSLDMDIASSPDEVYLSAEEETQEPDSQGVEKDVEIVLDDDDASDASDDDDSFDKMLVPDNGGDEEDEDDDDDSFDEMLRHCGKEVEKESSCSSLGKKSNGKNINKQIDVETENQMKNSVGKSSGNEPSLHRSSSNKAGSSKSALVEDKGKKSLPHRKEVDSCIEFCKRLGAELGLQAASVNRVLHQCSGDTLRTETYLKYGPKSKELPPWTEDEDEELLSNRNSRSFERSLVKMTWRTDTSFLLKNNCLCGYSLLDYEFHSYIHILTVKYVYCDYNIDSLC